MTRTIKLATGIALVIQRDPIVLAKEVATLDRLSGGRAILGIGGGWNHEVVPRLGEWERQRRTPREFWRAMGRGGFLCPWLPEAYGGSGAGFGISAVICEELGRTH